MNDIRDLPFGRIAKIPIKLIVGFHSESDDEVSF
jgi:hypothetical protein